MRQKHGSPGSLLSPGGSGVPVLFQLCPGWVGVPSGFPPSGFPPLPRRVPRREFVFSRLGSSSEQRAFRLHRETFLPLSACQHTDTHTDRQTDRSWYTPHHAKGVVVENLWCHATPHHATPCHDATVVQTSTNHAPLPRLAEELRTSQKMSQSVHAMPPTPLTCYDVQIVDPPSPQKRMLGPLVWEDTLIW
jgi:hypothetical protein